MSEALANFLWPGWHGGQLIALSGVEGGRRTDDAGGLVCRTETEGIAVVFPAAGRLRLTAPVLRAAVSCDCLIAETAAGPLRGAMLDAHHLLLEGPVGVVAMEPGLAVKAEGRRLLIGTEAAFQPAHVAEDLESATAARGAWVLAQPLLARQQGLRRHTVFRALSVMKGQVCSAEGAVPHRWTTPDRWPHKDMWLWDSVFHAIGWRHLDLPLAREMIEAVLSCQKPGGFVPHQASPSRRPSEITQPPVLAYGVALVDALSPDRDWIARLYPKLCAYVQWDLAHRDGDGDGLCEWFMEGDPNSRSGESGMDNSPRFDFHYPTPLGAVDFNAFLALECATLCRLANRLGMASEAALWQARADRLGRLIDERLWSGEANFYCDYDALREAHSPVLASAGFLPLLGGIPSLGRARRLLAHLNDPQGFGTAFPVPSVAAGSAHYAKDMWRGPSWINLNWLIARGLEVYAGQDAAFAAKATAIDAATVATIEAFCGRFATFFEYYDALGETDPPHLLRKGECNPENPFRQVIHDYGWTATLYLDLVARGA